MLAAIISMLDMLGRLKSFLEGDSRYANSLASVIELLNQLKSLGEEALSRILQRMNYIRELLIRDVLPPMDKFKEFLNTATRIIDCAAKPFTPEGWEVVEHVILGVKYLGIKAGGKFEWDPSKIHLVLVDEQKGDKSIEGNELRKKIKDKPVLNANVLDWLLANPELIPEEWKEKNICFWGTIYRHSSGSLGIRYLWNNDGWSWDFSWLGDAWRSDSPAAVLASN